MAKINIKSGNRIISIESDDAGVPDVTEGTGPDMIELQDDAMAEPGEENAEFNAAIDDSAVEEEDKTEAVEKANESFFDGIFGFGKKSTKKNSTESFFDGIFGLEDGEEAAITDDGDGTTSDTDEVVTSDDSSSDEVVTDDSEGEGAGEISEGDGTTTIDTGDTVITITNTDDSDDGDTNDDEVVTDSDDEPSTSTTPEAGEENANPDEMNNDQAIESFFQNLGL